jgi:hypothetical protein
MADAKLIERIARALAARKMGLVKDPRGDKLPDDLWQQMLPQATVAAMVVASIREKERG